MAPYFNPIELCKIGDYKDNSKKGSGKNLFDKDTVTRNKTFTSQGVVNDSPGLFISDYIKVEPNTTYYVNENAPVVIGLDENKNSLGYIRNINMAGSFTTQATCEYIRIRAFNTTIPMETAISKTMLNEGSTALPYEPYHYANKWYIEKQIGKVVLDGSESWQVSGTNTSGYNRFTSSMIYNLIDKPSTTGQVADILANYFIKKSADNTYQRQEGISVGTNGNLYIYEDSLKEYTAEQFKTWLSTHNTIVYYVLETPTTEEITDSALINQLEAIQSDLIKYKVSKELILDYDTPELEYLE